MTALVTLHSYFSRPDVLRLDVVASNLPAHFLGTAFDLVLPEQWQFDHEELCGIFRNDNPNFFHLVSFRPDASRVVFGLTVAGGGMSNPPDGCLASFYFRSKTFLQQRVMFDHATMSVYNNGRRDIADVRWEGTVLNGPVGPGSSEEVAAVSNREASQQFSASQQVLIPQTVRTDFLDMFDPGVGGVYLVILATLLLGLAVFALCLAYFRLRRKK